MKSTEWDVRRYVDMGDTVAAFAPVKARKKQFQKDMHKLKLFPWQPTVVQEILHISYDCFFDIYIVIYIFCIQFVFSFGSAGVNVI